MCILIKTKLVGCDFAMDHDLLTSLNVLLNKKPVPSNVHQYDTKLAHAFQVDCENLFEKFKQKQNLSFTSFSELWKGMCFLAIFKDNDNILGIQVFVENCFFITKKFLYASELYIQTAALYVLYGLYYKQPFKQWVKIRLTNTDLDRLEEIISVHKSMNMLDPVFIFAKMRIDGAFEYCAVPQPLGIEVKHMKRLDLGVDLSNENITIRMSKNSVINKFKNLMEQDSDLVQFEETDEEYQRLSQKYKEQLFIFPSKVGDNLKKVYSELFDVQLEDTPPDEQEQLAIAKKKALTNTNATYRGERKVVTALDLDLDIDRPSTSK